MQNQMIKIATILTCFNRKEKTVSSLRHLFSARNSYNERHDEQIKLVIYLTDDACTDGTPEAVREVCKGEELHIIKGNGQCYWAGGMRLAWKEALKKKELWDYYLLLNDDTFVLDNVFDEFKLAESYCKDTFHKVGLYSGVTHAVGNPKLITYSGDKYTSKFMGKLRRVQPNGKPQRVDMTNANILLVDKTVVEEIGIFDEHYKHSNADYDYSNQANKNGFAVVITANACGVCEYDHVVGSDDLKIASISLRERKKYLSHPLHSDKEYLYYIKKNRPSRFLVSWILRKVRLYFPTLYYSINKARCVY